MTRQPTTHARTRGRGSPARTTGGPARASSASSSDATSPVRVAIYTRKSVAKGLDQEFSSIDAQRAAVEAYVAAQAAQGLRWRALPERYDDGGFSGANTDRPALARLMEDVEAGRVDVVAVYKIDRLSRSLVDFANLTRTLESHDVGFVSVTQQFNTATSMGKLTLNILISFAQFERQVIAERTADKIAASRRRGMWTGGRPVLGYDPVNRKLVVNPAEAERVRAIFALYLDVGSINGTLSELRRRGWRNKAWTTARGTPFGGDEFTAISLRMLLTNQLYLARVRSPEGMVRATHDAIVDEELFARAGRLLESRGSPSGRNPRQGWNSLLGGLVTCGRCGKPMGHVWGSRRGRRYRYYVCAAIQKRGAAACPGSRAPAAQLDEVVVARVRAIGKDQQLVAEVATAIADAERALLPAARERLERAEAGHRDAAATARRLLDAVEASGRAGDRDLIAAAEGRLRAATERAAATAAEVEAARADVAACEQAAMRGGAGIGPEAIREALERFDGVWDRMTPVERGEVVRALVERVVCDVAGGEVRIEFSAKGARMVATGGEMQEGIDGSGSDEDPRADAADSAAGRAGEHHSASEIS